MKTPASLKEMQNIAALRLFNQQIAGPSYKDPSVLVSYLCALQAQDYYGAKWSVALRIPGTKDSEVEKAIAERKIIRSWPMRGTLHFVHASDLRWMLKLLAPFGNKRREPYDKKLGLDERFFERGKEVLSEVLMGGRELTREELSETLRDRNIDPGGNKLNHLLYKATLDQMVCFGIRRGKQFTFTLIDDWVKDDNNLEGSEALAELTYRYFRSRGPASLQDFVWWTGMTTSAAREGLDLVKARLTELQCDGKTYWLDPETFQLAEKQETAFLLPGFDEYLLAYRDRSAVVEKDKNKLLSLGNGIFSSTIIINGRVAGTWNRQIKRNKAEINLMPFAKLKKNEKRLVEEAAIAYGNYLDMNAELLWG